MLRTIYNNDTWGLVQQEKENGQACSFRYKGKDAELAYFFIKRLAGEVCGETYYDIVTSRGESGIELLSGSLSEELLSEFDREFNYFCEENNIVCEYVRFDPWNPVAESFRDIYNLQSHGYAYCVDLLDDDFFKHQCSSKRRNLIRKSLGSGLTIEDNVPYREGIPCLLDLYEFTDNKYSVSEYYKLSKEFLSKYIEILGKSVSFCIVKFDDTPISVGMFLNGGDVYHYHFSASNPKYSCLNAPSLMLYKEMLKAKDEGCRYFDLGSATPGSGLEVFKKSWCSEGNILKCFLGTKIRLQEIYQKLIEINGRANNGYFPEYKRI